MDRDQQTSDSEQVELRFLESLKESLPGDDAVLRALGDLYTRTGRFDDGYAIDLELTRLAPDDPAIWYNLACSQALLNKKSEAFGSLDRAVDLGYSDDGHMREDSDLESLRDDPRFEGLILRMTVA